MCSKGNARKLQSDGGSRSDPGLEDEWMPGYRGQPGTGCKLVAGAFTRR
ncbi:hypothetical protein AWB69_08451 [Caballeronia udeis]|uniref:Uncharacterized protein n=1 Tax=Caballeronia udeis TaxID=1232866 RepID=A0A158JPL8_9BURK|nr:hypothetical protein AWB69_08451 [Caballeronia udeis]